MQLFMDTQAQAFSVQNNNMLIYAFPIRNPEHARIMVYVLRKWH